MYNIEKERNERRAKQTDIENFLDDNKDEFIWIATSAGIFQGTIYYQSDTMLTLQNAFHYIGTIMLSVGEVNINLGSVVAWGNEKITMRNNFAEKDSN